MIGDDEQFDQALAQLARMYHALAALRRDVLPQSREQFAVLAEGPLAEIRRLESDLAAYSGRSVAESRQSALR